MLEKLNNMKIRERLKKSFTLISTIMAAVAVIGVVMIIVVSNLYSGALSDYGFAQGDVGRAMASFADTRSALRGTIGYEEQEAIDSMVEQHTQCKEDFMKEFAGDRKSVV